jgi:protein phosphatase
MRGNHEGPKDMIPYPHNLPLQFKQKYGEEAGTRIYKELRRLFDLLYNAVLIDKYAILIHGGFPSGASSLEDLAYAHKKHPKETFLEEMLWSDPQEELSGTLPSLRGAGKFFGADVTKRILKLLDVKVLIRGHEPCEEGYKINHDRKVLTLFSTNKPPYNNKYAAYLQVDLLKKIRNAQTLKKHIKQFE